MLSAQVYIHCIGNELEFRQVSEMERLSSDGGASPATCEHIDSAVIYNFDDKELRVYNALVIL